MALILGMPPAPDQKLFGHPATDDCQLDEVVSGQLLPPGHAAGIIAQPGAVYLNFDVSCYLSYASLPEAMLRTICNDS